MTQGEKDEYSGLEETAMIRLVVQKMPASFRDCFEHFALQLQTVVNTTTRVRMALEEKKDDDLQGVMEESDGFGVVQQVLKHAVVQASKEVSEIHSVQSSWSRVTEARLERMMQSAER